MRALRTHHSRTAYSAVNRIVNTHSIRLNRAPWRAPIASTLSNMTTATLARIARIRTRSNNFPVGVRDRKITTESLLPSRPGPFPDAAERRGGCAAAVATELWQ